MANNSTDINLITFSVRVYQLLLNAYPAKFQQEYGLEMVQVFQDCCLRATRQGGKNGMIRLWAVTLFDLIQSVISEHAQKEIEMKKEMNPEDVRMAGWALIWGAVAFVIGMFLLSMRDPDLWPISGILVIFLSMPLLVAGLLAVRNRYGGKVGGFGKNILLIGAILGPLISLIGFFGNSDSSWIVAYSGPAVLYACLALFGIVALYKKPLPRWNAVPIIAGICYPILILFFILTSSTIDWESSSSTPMFMAVTNIAFIIQGIALAALGYILKSDVPEETAALV